MKAVAALALALLAGCAGKPVIVPQEVRYPVYTRVVPPAGLLSPISRPEIVFAPPDPGAAQICMPTDSARNLRGYVTDLESRLSEWIHWSE